MSLQKGIEKLNFLKKRKLDEINEQNVLGTIFIERRQVSTNNPAVGQVIVELPETTNANIRDIYEKCLQKFPLDADVHEITEISSRKHVIEIRSTKLMYAWFEYFIKKCQYTFKNVKTRGYWQKYDA